MRKLTKNDKIFLDLGVDFLIFRYIEVIKRDITMTSFRNRAGIKITGRGCMTAYASVEFGTEVDRRVHSTMVDRG